MSERIKTGGRKKGTPNKTTSELRAIIKQFVDDELSRISNKLNELTTYERFTILTKLIPYAMPKADNSMNERSPVEPTTYVIVNADDINKENK